MDIKGFRWLLVGILLLAANYSAFAQSDVTLSGDGSTNLAPYLQQWIPDKPAGLEQAIAADREGKFQTTENLAIPVLNRDVWYRFRFHIKSPLKDPLVLNFQELLYNKLEVFYRHDGHWRNVRIGVDQPLTERPIEYRFFAVPLEAEPGISNVVYFRINAFTRSFVAPHLETRNHFFASALKQTIISVSILGVLAGTILYMWTLSRVVLEPAKQFAFIGLLISSFLYVFLFDGHLVRIAGGRAHFSLHVYILSTALLNLFNLLYCRYCLNIYAINHIIGRINDFIIVFILLSAGYSLFFVPEQANAVAVRTTAATLIMMVAISVAALIARQRGAVYYSLAIFSYLAIVIYKILVSYGGVAYTENFRNYTYIGALSLTFFLSLSIMRQLSINRARQLELERKAIEAEARDSAKGRFLMAMGQEIRSPINGVLGMAQLLSESRLDSTQRNYIEVLLNSAKNLQNVINDILDLSKVQANSLYLEQVDFNLDQLLVYTVTAFSQKNNTKPVKFDLEEIHPLPFYLKGDPTRLQQIINNLLQQSFKTTERGFVSLKASQLSPSGTSVTLKFSLVDSSPGILSDDQKGFFDSDIRPDPTQSFSDGGASLSLAICKRLVELMDGRMGVISRAGQGNEFWFTVKITVDTQRQQLLEASTAKLKDTKLAIVFGNPLLTKGLVGYFSSNGISVQNIDYDISLEEVDFDKIDLLLLSNAIGEFTEAWLHQALKQGTEMLLFNGLDNNVLSTSELKGLKVRVINPPYGISQIIEVIEKMISGGNSDDLSHFGAIPNYHNLSNLKILVAEDNSISTKVIEAILKSHNINADFVTTGVEAIRAYEEANGDYDLILMDYQMPELDGCGATMKIREIEHKTSMVPTMIYATTAYTSGDYKIHCMQAGMNGILTKPLQKSLLVELLESVNTKYLQPGGIPTSGSE